MINFNEEHPTAKGIRNMFGQPDILVKGGEGSRGGKVIGHTESGKPIYDTHGHEMHTNFTTQDHWDASNVHLKKLTDLKESDPDFKSKSEHHKLQGGMHSKKATSNVDVEGDLKKSIEQTELQLGADILNTLEKGRKAEPIGTRKTWGGKDYVKTANGWTPKNEIKEAHDKIHGGGEKKEEGETLQSAIDFATKKWGTNNDRNTNIIYNEKTKEHNYNFHNNHKVGDISESGGKVVHIIPGKNKEEGDLSDLKEKHKKLTESNNHGEAAKLLVDKFGDDDEKTTIDAINKRHKERGHLTEEDGKRRSMIVGKYYDKYIKD